MLKSLKRGGIAGIVSCVLAMLLFSIYVSSYSTGEVMWSSSFSSNHEASPHAVAVDSSGVYVVGRTQGTALSPDYWRVEKRNLDGGLLWESGGSISDAQAQDVAVDSSGVYVVGYRNNGVTGYIEKRNLNNGNPIWVKDIDIYPNSGTTIIEEIHGVAVDSTGVYLAGQTGSDWRVQKRSLDGNNVIWDKSFTSAGTLPIPYALAVDSSGVYVVGKETISGGVSYTWRMEKRNLNTGEVVWAQKGGTVNSGPAFNVAVDSTGVYISGEGEFSGSHTFTWRVQKRNLGTGTLVWSKQESFSDRDDMPSGIAVDSSGVYVVGYQGIVITNGLPSSTLGEGLWRVERRNLNTGNVEWFKNDEFSSGSVKDYANDVAVDSSGVYVVGAQADKSVWRVEKRSKLQQTCTPEVCTDGIDNDCDGAADCYDSTCLGVPTPSGICCSKDSDCSLKPSVETDNGFDFTVGGSVTDYTGSCSSSKVCAVSLLSDYCDSPTLLQEYFIPSLSVYSSGKTGKSCGDYDNSYPSVCVGKLYMKKKIGCGGTPAYCADSFLDDVHVGTDVDKDGVDRECGDTNDNDPNIPSVTVEICDNLDNDKDGFVDEGCDDDGDGYCDVSMTVVGTPSVCPNGGGDTDDNNPIVNPGASEVCTYPAALDENGDGFCDYDNFKCSKGDSACKVGVTGVSVSSLTPAANFQITVSCTVSQAGVTSIDASVGGVSCPWGTAGYWSGNVANFVCGVGAAGVKDVKCSVNTLKSVPIVGQEQKSVSITVGSPVLSCTNECSSFGQTQCVNFWDCEYDADDYCVDGTETYRDFITCGNYDTDSCLEWGVATNCPSFCSNNNCNLCVANAGTSCGSCGGKVNCDGTCSVVTPSNFGQSCSTCGGVWQCGGVCSKPQASCPKEICTIPAALDEDSNKDCDYDDSICPHGDIVCPVGINSISVDNPNPVVGSTVQVTCESTVYGVTSISAMIVEELKLCTPNPVWNGNFISFSCNPSVGQKTIRCFVDEDKSYADKNNGLDKKETTVTVEGSDCSKHTSESACIANKGKACEWCPSCKDGKSSGRQGDQCVDKGSCLQSEYQCYKDKCGAKCDFGTGGCGASEKCDLNSCSCVCNNECSFDGETKCSSDSTGQFTCGNYDADSCLEWGGSVLCGSGILCSNGVCNSNCAPEVCDNGVDDDCDGLSDCADLSCVSSGSESVCSDGKDNDCDNMIDCNDPDCVGVVCNEASSDFFCVDSSCEQCSFVDGDWAGAVDCDRGTCVAAEGDLVGLVAYGSKACFGKSFDLNVVSKGWVGFDDVAGPFSGVFGVDSVSADWLVVYRDPGLYQFSVGGRDVPSKVFDSVLMVCVGDSDCDGVGEGDICPNTPYGEVVFTEGSNRGCSDSQWKCISKVDCGSVLWGECDDSTNMKTRVICKNKETGLPDPGADPKTCCDDQSTCLCSVENCGVKKRSSWIATKRECLVEEEFPFFTLGNVVVVLVILALFYFFYMRGNLVWFRKSLSKRLHK